MSAAGDAMTAGGTSAAVVVGRPVPGGAGAFLAPAGERRAGLGRADVSAFVLIAVVAVAIRVLFAASVPPFIDPDAEGYYLPGHDLAFGLPFEPDLRRTPGYPVFIAGVIRMFGESLQALVTVQHVVVGPPVAALTYVLGRLLGTGRLVALTAGLLAAVDGPLLVYENYILTDGLFTLLLLVLLVCTVWTARRVSLSWAAITGLVFGVGILCRPAGQLLAPLLAGTLLLGAGTRRRRLAAVALCGLVALLVVVPWMASNAARHGTFAIAGSGRYLLARVVKNDPGGYSFEAPPGAVEDETRAAARRIVQEEAARGRPGSSAQRFREELGLSEAETSRILSDLSIQAVRGRPSYYILQSLHFAWEIMEGDPIAIRREGMEWKEIDWDRRVRQVLQLPINRLDAARAQALVGVYDPARYGPLVPLLFGLGLLLAAAGLAPRGLLLPGLVALVLVGSSAALVGPIVRYRAPADPLIALVAAQAVATVASLGLARRRRVRLAAATPPELAHSPR